MVKNWEINGTEEIGLVTPTPGLWWQEWTPFASALSNRCFLCIVGIG